MIFSIYIKGRWPWIKVRRAALSARGGPLHGASLESTPIPSPHPRWGLKCVKVKSRGEGSHAETDLHLTGQLGRIISRCAAVSLGERRDAGMCQELSASSQHPLLTVSKCVGGQVCVDKGRLIDT